MTALSDFKRIEHDPLVARLRAEVAHLRGALSAIAYLKPSGDFEARAREWAHRGLEAPPVAAGTE